MELYVAAAAQRGIVVFCFVLFLFSVRENNAARRHTRAILGVCFGYSI